MIQSVELLVWNMNLNLTLGTPVIDSIWGEPATRRARPRWQRVSERAKPRWQAQSKAVSGNWQERRR